MLGSAFFNKKRLDSVGQTGLTYHKFRLHAKLQCNFALCKEIIDECAWAQNEYLMLPAASTDLKC